MTFTRPIPRAAVAMVMVLALAGAAPAMDIPLPDLAGGYEFMTYIPPNFGYPDVRTIDFTVPEEITAIEDVRLVISGEMTAGELVCEGSPDPSPLIPPMGLYLSSDAFPGQFFLASVEVPDGPFTGLSASLWSCCPEGAVPLDQLVGATVHGEMFMDIAIVGICAVSVDAVCVLTDVHLEVDAPVGAEARTWSSVRQDYR
jgi:hypothetical protein